MGERTEVVLVRGELTLDNEDWAGHGGTYFGAGGLEQELEVEDKGLGEEQGSRLITLSLHLEDSGDWEDCEDWEGQGCFQNW